MAAGNGRGSVSRRNRGIAAESDLIIVKLAGRDDGFPRTTEVMEGLDYVLRKAIRLQQPIAVNLSFGNNYGPHDGRSLFENYISELNGVWKNMIVVAAGNEGNARHHTQVTLPKGDFRIYGNGGFDGSRINSDNSTEVEFALAEGEHLRFNCGNPMSIVWNYMWFHHPGSGYGCRRKVPVCGIC